MRAHYRHCVLCGCRTSQLGTSVPAVPAVADNTDAVPSVQTDFLSLSNQVHQQQFEISDMELRLANLEKLAASNTSTSEGEQSQSSVQMPASVAAQIRADAEAQFPNDYEEQVFIIKQQTEAWYKLHQ